METPGVVADRGAKNKIFLCFFLKNTGAKAAISGGVGGGEYKETGGGGGGGITL